MREYWTTQDCARALSVDPATARRWAKRDDFPAPAFATAGGISAWDADAVRNWRTHIKRDRRMKRERTF